MPSSGPSFARPVYYRLTFALLLALLLHSLGLLALYRSLQQPSEPLPATAVHLQLMAAGKQESRHSLPSAEQPAAPPQQPEPRASAGDTATVVTSSRSEPTPLPQPAPEQAPRAAKATAPVQPSTTPPKPTPTVKTKSVKAHPSAAATASQARDAGSPVEATPPMPDSKPPQTHTDPVARDPYVALLWQRISSALSERPVHSLGDIREVRVVHLELQLMDNGTLIQLHTVESSGNPALDRAARQGALAASPYPEPPTSAQERDYRYQVELRFTPRRS